MNNLLILLAGHFIADFSLQPKYMIEDKMKGDDFGYLTLVGHCATQALILGGLMNLIGYHYWFEFACFIFLTHLAIDFGKIKKRYNVWVDQLLHYSVIGLIWLSQI